MLIEVLNERFGTNFTPADQFFFDQVHAEAIGREDIQQAALANSYEDFRSSPNRPSTACLSIRMEGNEDIFRRVMEDERFPRSGRGPHSADCLPADTRW